MMNTGVRPGENELRIGRGEPSHHLAGDPQRSAKRGQERRQPRTHGNDRRPGIDVAAVRDDAHVARARLERSHPLAGADVCPGRGRERKLRRNRALCLEHAAIRLEDGDIIRRHSESREAAHQFRCGDHLVGQIVDPGAAQRSLDQHAIGRADLGDAGHMQKLTPRRSFEVTPEAVGVPQQRHVRGMLEVPEPNDARVAMGRAAVMTGSIALDSQHPLASAR